MNFVAEIDIMPHKELLDPQGKSVALNMKNLHLNTISDIRIGKHISLSFSASDEKEATEIVETACKKLLANLIMESYTYSIKAA